MSEPFETGSKSTLMAIHLRPPGSNQSGRVFLPASLFEPTMVDDLAMELGRQFIEDDDEARLELLLRELAAPKVTVKTLPSEHTPVAYYAYVRSQLQPGESLFACVLATTSVLEELIASPPHMVFETATFQAIGEEASAATLRAGLESWLHRVFPNHAVPRFSVVQWPELEELQTFKERTIALPRMQASRRVIHGAPSQLDRPPYPFFGEGVGP